MSDRLAVMAAVLSVGIPLAGGQAADWTYDSARAVAAMRQGPVALTVRCAGGEGLVLRYAGNPKVADRATGDLGLTIDDEGPYLFPAPRRGDALEISGLPGRLMEKLGDAQSLTLHMAVADARRSGRSVMTVLDELPLAGLRPAAQQLLERCGDQPEAADETVAGTWNRVPQVASAEEQADWQGATSLGRASPPPLPEPTTRALPTAADPTRRQTSWDGPREMAAVETLLPAAMPTAGAGGYRWRSEGGRAGLLFDGEYKLSGLLLACDRPSRMVLVVDLPGLPAVPADLRAAVEVDGKGAVRLPGRVMRQRMENSVDLVIPLDARDGLLAALAKGRSVRISAGDQSVEYALTGAGPVVQPVVAACAPKAAPTARQARPAAATHGKPQATAAKSAPAKGKPAKPAASKPAPAKSKPPAKSHAH